MSAPSVIVFSAHSSAGAEGKAVEIGFPYKKAPTMGRDHHTDERAVGSDRNADRIKIWGIPGAMSLSADFGPPGMTASTGLKLSELTDGDVVSLFGGRVRGRADSHAGPERATPRVREKRPFAGPTAPN